MCKNSITLNDTSLDKIERDFVYHCSNKTYFQVYDEPLPLLGTLLCLGKGDGVAVEPFNVVGHSGPQNKYFLHCRVFVQPGQLLLSW